MSKAEREIVSEDSDSLAPGTGIAAEAADQVAVAEKSVSGAKVESAADDGILDIGNSIKKACFSPLQPSAVRTEQSSMDLLLDVALDLSVELGRTSIPVRDILQLGPGSILELDKLAGEPVDIMVNGKLIAKGEVVVVDENFGIRVTEIASRTERINGLA